MYVGKLVESYVEESKADLPDDEIRKKARRLATYHLQWDGAAADTLERGFVIEEEIGHDGGTHTITKLNRFLRPIIGSTASRWNSCGNSGPTALLMDFRGLSNRL